jgi:hypothetical protein
VTIIFAVSALINTSKLIIYALYVEPILPTYNLCLENLIIYYKKELSIVKNVI